MKRTLASERGVAMLAALGAIILIGIIMAGVLFSVTQDSRISDNSMRQSRATSTAELGLNRISVETTSGSGRATRSGRRSPPPAAASSTSW